jgi:hypothetical protein
MGDARWAMGENGDGMTRPLRGWAEEKSEKIRYLRKFLTADGADNTNEKRADFFSARGRGPVRAAVSPDSESLRLGAFEAPGFGHADVLSDTRSLSCVII